MNIVRGVLGIPSYVLGAVLPNPAVEPLLQEKVRQIRSRRETGCAALNWTMSPALDDTQLFLSEI